jgi:subtilisin family serine protease
MKPIKPSKSQSSPSRDALPNVTAEGLIDTGGMPTGPTGRFLVTFQDAGQGAALRSLKDVAGLNAATTSDYEGAEVTEADIRKSDALFFEHLNVAVVEADPSRLSALKSSVLDNSKPIVAVEPEEYVHALQENETREGQSLLSEAGVSYLSGYQDGIGSLVRALASGGQPMVEDDVYATVTYSDTASLTWGLQAVLANRSPYTGRGIRIAVLDTGFDLNHPDFAGRTPITTSFVPGEAVQDGHGHGTHCIGTSCGPKAPAGTARRYGVAPEATILAGKVLSNAGSGMDAWILAGINWALQNKAVVISMSLGSPVQPGQAFKQAYEQAAVAALNANCVIIAAAGNNGNTPVGSPANCPSIMAVAAVDSNLQRASFSCIGINPNGGEVNIAGPGVAVYSSTKMPARYASWAGTSMATPHVAGCAALWAQYTGLRGKPLWNRLTNAARNIGLPAQQVGAGLVQAPVVRVPIRPFPPFRPPQP